ncbi:MAG: hypothetical protein MJ069_00435 [Salinivirgaceae bacterium]|nr:hypothetical protein [Salinivirgaceae bacterium]
MNITYTYNYKQTVNVNYIGITRGYTGHEHWNQFGLIDMNFAIEREQSEYVVTYSAMPSVSKMGEANFGRFYDPVVGRFLSPDPYVQDPSNPQNFNRYSYCLNNPLKYNDPSGESAVLTAAIIGAVIGTYIGGTMANNTYNPIKWNYSELKTWGYMGGGAIVGAASGAAGAYVGSTVGGYFASSSFVAGSASGAAAGAVGGTISGAGYSWLDGASFKQGAWKGFVSGNVGALTGGLLGGIVGGIDAYCDGRNAWTGKEVAMGRSRLAFNNTDLLANKYQVGPGEVRNANYINEEMASSNPKYDYAKYGKVDKNGLSTGTISKYQNYTMESREYEVFQNFKGRAYLEVKSTGTFDVSFSLDGKIITPDSNGLFHLPQGCKLLQINMIRSETSSMINAVSPLRFTIQGYSIP